MVQTLLRAAVLFEAVIAFVLSGATIFFYATGKNGSRAPRTVKIHVLMLATGYLLLLVTIVGFMWDSLREQRPILWYGAPCLILGLFISNMGLARIFTFQRAYHYRQPLSGEADATIPSPRND